MDTPIKLASAIALALGVASPSVYSAALPRGAQLTITGTVTASSGAWASGSYFGMDNNGNAKIADTEKTGEVMGTRGIVIGATTTAGASHSGLPTGGDTNVIDAPWNFFGNTGSHFNTVAITGSTAGMVMNGWRVTWNGIPSINMSTGAWTTGTGAGHTGATGTFTNGVGNLTWNGTNGGAYVLNYRATVPAGDPSGFGGVKYELHLEGVVNNDAPTISVPNVSALPSTLQAFTVTAADANPSTGVANTSLTCSISSQGATGTATVQANCSGGTYTDTSGAPGTDSFTVRVSDGLDTATDTVNVTIMPDTPPPTAQNFPVVTVGTTPTSIDFNTQVTTIDDNIDWTTLNITCSNAANILNNNDGTATYTAAYGFTGIDECTYTVADIYAEPSNMATVSIAVYTNIPASNIGNFSGSITTSAPEDGDMAGQCIGGCFDYIINNLNIGNIAQVVLPLNTTIPENAVYRSYMNGAWQHFVSGSGDAVASAQRTTVLAQSTCPPAGSPGYTPGLITGNDCIQLMITDGGFNDSDATPGQIANIGGLAATISIPSVGGMGIIGWSPGFVASAMNSMSGYLSLAQMDMAGINRDTDPTINLQCSPICIDLNVDISGNSGGTANIVLPLMQPISANSVYRVFNTTNFAWRNFVVDGLNNKISSAMGSYGSCPSPSSSAYLTGLIEGYNCIQVTLHDGGPNDNSSITGLINTLGSVSTLLPDHDGDGMADQRDNCTLVSNGNQRDTNGDGFGNICDPDLNNDGIVNFIDLGMLRSEFYSSNPDADLNGDGRVNFTDLGILKSMFFGLPGPSGIAQ